MAFHGLLEIAGRLLNGFEKLSKGEFLILVPFVIPRELKAVFNGKLAVFQRFEREVEQFLIFTDHEAVYQFDVAKRDLIVPRFFSPWWPENME